MSNKLMAPAPWAEPITIYISWLRSANRPDSTIKQYSYRLRRFAADTGRDPFAVTVDDLTSYLGAEHRLWGRNTRRGARNALRSFYTWAHSTGRMTTNPALLTPPAPAKRGYARPASADAIAFGLWGADERSALLVLLGYKMGLRCIEMSLCHTSDLRREGPRWILRVHGKGERDRDVPVPPDVLARIQRLPAGWFFPGQIDGHLSNGHVSKLLSRALPEGVTGHMLRHSAATRVHKAAGGNIRITQRFLGHASSETTDIYTEVEEPELHDAVLAAAAA
ncbi:tyrosine-type recombinase/integrase [Herbiconiux flava]|uniref:Integrase n=1 Tax=Herbiconiux flava TaxID=881268 RepID=A0A852STH4_9MICO|nr:tyrosine-type recombinase/integrase [Herbiconiux flava]NYD72286.1 integrase [Herbiconiux flava]GLK17751.1 integrase [Herbiconiux flava]